MAALRHRIERTPVVRVDIGQSFSQMSALNSARLAQAACIVLLSRYMFCDEVLITKMTTKLGTNDETALLGRNSAANNYRVEPGMTVQDLLRVLEHAPLSWRCEHSGPSDKPSPLSFDTSTIQLLPVEISFANLQSSLEDIPLLQIDSDTPIIYLIQTFDGSFEIKSVFDSSKIAAPQAERFQLQLAELLKQIMLAPHETKLDGLSSATPLDRDNLLQWNSRQQAYSTDLPPFPSILQLHALKNPEHVAVCAWDGELTYSELLMFSETLAETLVQAGVKRNTFVPILFQKTCWEIVAMLGILAAGAAYVPLDPSYPLSRMRDIVEQTKADFILTSQILKPSVEALESRCKTLSVDRSSLYEMVLRLERDSLEHSKLLNNSNTKSISSKIITAANSLEGQTSPLRPRISRNALLQGSNNPKGPNHNLNLPSSTDAAYCIFTSGSTGTPKGVVIEHQSLSHYCTFNRENTFLNSQTRMLHYSTLVYDASVIEIFLVLANGGCVCIPSEWERVNDLVGVINRMAVNHIMITPSVLTTLKPEDIPKVKRLLIGGEAATSSLVSEWAPHFNLVNLYGPTEGTVAATCYDFNANNPDAITIGSADGTHCWVTAAGNPQRLCAIGEIGELLIEGTQLAREYLHDAAKTEAAFIPAPLWHPLAESGCRLYRTGDLVVQREGGQFVYLGRHTTEQVKISGRRIELGDVASHVATALGSNQVLADLIRFKDSGEQPVLVAFVSIGTTEKASLDDPWVVSEPLEATKLLKLSKNLPKLSSEHMIPRLYVPVVGIPRSAGGKADRNPLRRECLNLQMSDFIPTDCGPDSHPVESLSTMAVQLRHIWAQVLKNGKHPNPDDDFISMGGDSLKAIRFAQQAAKVGIRCDVQTVLQARTLRNLEATAVFSVSTEFESDSFSLLKTLSAGNMAQIQRLCATTRSAIEDIYPCTPAQESMIVLSEQQPESYFMDIKFSLSDEVDLESLRLAWQWVTGNHGILRSTFVRIDGLGLLQVVMRHAPNWTFEFSKFSESPIHLMDGLSHGTIPSRVILRQNQSESILELHWLVHHSIVEGWSVSQFLKQLTEAYAGIRVSSFRPFRDFALHAARMDLSAALNFYTQHLANAPASDFPPKPYTGYKPLAKSLIERTIPLLPVSEHQFTPATIIRAAWAVLLSKYQDANDVVFGSVSSGRTEPLAGIEHILGPTMATMPFRVTIQENDTIHDLLDRINNHALASLPFEQVGISNLRSIHGVEAALKLHNILVVQPEEYMTSKTNTSAGTQSLLIDVDDISIKYTHGLNVECFQQRDAVCVKFTYDENMISPFQADKLLDHFGTLLAQIHQAKPSTSLNSVTMFAKQDALQVQTWNDFAIPVVAETIQEVIAKHVSLSPYALAIDSWDGKLSYYELDSVSSRLALILRNHGVGPEVIVGLVFEKSIRAAVSMLAVLKAGGACLSIDPSLPLKRREYILVEKGQITVGLCSSKYKHLLEEISTQHVIIVDETSLEPVDSNSLPQELPPVHPENSAFICFTSGSTGAPKGIILEHQAICTSARAYGALLNLGPSSRVFQFAAYTFDVSIGDMFTTLMHGGTVCIPSDFDRMNRLSDIMREFQVDQAYLTNSVAAQLEPTEVPTLRTLSVGGEAVTSQCLEKWADAVCLIELYGPAETTIFSTGKAGLKANDHPGNTGKGLGGYMWIVEATDRNRLCPIGCVGELLIEGPILARGYLRDEDKTKAAFIQNPKWATTESFPRTRRFYATGDMAKYSSDGDIILMGRKDRQVKLRGQRIELSEIEHHLRSVLEEGTEFAVDIADIEGSGMSLCAFFGMTGGFDFTDSQNMDQQMDSLSAETKLKLATISQNSLADLAHLVPHYMVPSLCLPISALPLSVNGKLDRKRLIQGASSLRRSHLAQLSTTESNKEDFQTKQERLLAEVWSNVLNLDVSRIARNSSFVRLGGDSVRAMTLVGTLRHRHKLQITVAEIFASRNLKEMACALQDIADNFQQTLSLPQVMDPLLCAQAIAQTVDASFPIEKADIVAMYEVTPLQEGLFALGMKESFAYVAQLVCELPSSIDLTRFKSAWEETIQTHEILRTRFIQPNESKLMQIIVRDDFQWKETPDSDLESCILADSQNPMTLGTPLCRLWCIAGTHILLTIHHAIYDDVSLKHMFEFVEKKYNQQQLPCESHVPFRQFINHLQGIDLQEEKKFWCGKLDGAARDHFPSLPFAGYQSRPDAELTRGFLLPTTVSDYTFSTFIQAALGILLAKYTGSPDVVYGLVMNGRLAQEDWFGDVHGPLITTIPSRVQIPAVASTQEYLNRIQQSGIQVLDHQHFGIQNIKALSDDSASACNFTTLLIIQNDFYDHKSAPGFVFEPVNALRFGNYALNLECVPKAGYASIVARFDSRVLDQTQAGRFLDQLDHILTQLMSNIDQPLSSVDGVSAEDLETIWSWNRNLPPKIENTIQQMIGQKVLKHPQKQAICSWDGDMTYQELDDEATLLSHRLQSLGVGKGDVIPLIFPKTRFLIVSILSVLKAGAAFVLIEPSQPNSRQEFIVQVTRAQLILASDSYTELALRLVDQVLTVDQMFLLSLNQASFTSSHEVVDVHHSSTAYIVFTSGSTGNPKGIRMSHSAYCTSAIGHGVPTLQLPEWRMLFFASHAFDGVMSEVITSLIMGATICVPHDDERNDRIVNAINRMKVDWAFMTPSFANILNPEDMPSLKALCVGGERAPPGFIEKWRSKSSLTLVAGYGPSECATASAANAEWAQCKNPANIGKSLGGILWITDPNDPDHLAPVGATGELLVEGHTLADGYLDDPDKTAKAFIPAPQWLRERRNDPTRVYRTGDLVRYETDGTIIFVGRRDNQIKIRGQRIETGDVESAISKCLKDAADVAVEAVSDENGTKSLVGFLARSRTSDHIQDGFEILSSDNDIAWCQEQLEALRGPMSQNLTPAMTPKIFIPITKLPIGATGKLDRRRLQDIYFSCDKETITRFLGASVGRAVETENEKLLSRCWSSVLDIDQKAIRASDNFFHKGGHSLSAMRLSARISESGFSLTVKQIFEAPVLSDMALSIKVKSESSITIPSFALLAKSTEIEALVDASASALRIEPSEVEDIYPCVPLQEGLIALSTVAPGAYTATFVFSLSENVNLARFKTAWNTVVEDIPMLRTRSFQDSSLGMLQVVSKSLIPWEEIGNIDKYLSELANETYSIGDPFVRLGMSKTHFVISAHHASYDGYFLQMLLGRVRAIYNGEAPISVVPYRSFVHHVTESSNSASRTFWVKTLEGFDSLHFPEIPPNLRPLSDSTFDQRIAFHKPDSKHTVASLIRAGVSLLLSKYTGFEDIAFGVTVSGRDSSMSGIESLGGPTIATVPFRSKLNWQMQTIEQLLQSCQDRTTSMIPFCHFGIQNLKKFNSSCSLACEFATLLIIQPQESALSDDDQILGSQSMCNGIEVRHTYPLTLELSLSELGAIVHVDFDSRLLERHQVERLVSQLEWILQNICASTPDCLLKDLHTISPSDYSWCLQHQAMNHNSEPATQAMLLHDAVREWQKQTPESLAVMSPTENMTYDQLDLMSNRLAVELSQKNLKGRTVLIIFESSIFSVISLIAVSKVGASFVLLDASDLPESRSKFFQSLNPKLTLCTTRTHVAAREYSIEILAVSSATLALGTTTVFATEVEASQMACAIDVSKSPFEELAKYYDHYALVSAARDTAQSFDQTQGRKSLLAVSPASNIGLQTIIGTLISGGVLCLVDQSIDQGDHKTLSKAMEIFNPDYVQLSGQHFKTLDSAFSQKPSKLIVDDSELILWSLDPAMNLTNRLHTFSPRLSPLTPLVIEARKNLMHLKKPSPASNCRTWIVDPFNQSQLSLPGTPGYLAIESLGLPVTQKSNHISQTDVPYLESASFGKCAEGTNQSSRICVTETLCYHNSEGEIVLICPEITSTFQGRRFLPHYMENTINQKISSDAEFCVDLVRPVGSKHKIPILFARDEKAQSNSSVFSNQPFVHASDQAFSETTKTLSVEFSKLLQLGIDDIICVPSDKLRRSPRSKIDRERLREAASRLTRKEILAYSKLGHSEKAMPTSSTQQTIASLWGLILGCDVDSIGLHDSFLILGGDSISAMRLASHAQKSNMGLTTDIIFQNPVLEDMCNALAQSKDPIMVEKKIEPFELVGGEGKALELSILASEYCSVSRELIEDILPITRLQQDLMERSLEKPGRITVRFIYEIPPNVSLDRLASAWTEVVQRNEMARTRILRINGQYLQVFLREGEVLMFAKSLDEYLAKDASNPMGLGTPLMRYAIVQEESGQRYFVHTAHHSAYDGWSMQLLLDQLNKVYCGIPLGQPTSFSGLLDYEQRLELEESENFWKSHLVDPPVHEWCQIPTNYAPNPIVHTFKQIQLSRLLGTQITLGTIIHGAWALTLHKHFKSKSVVLGLTMSGRSAPVPDAETIAAPFITMFPLKVDMVASETLNAFLDRLQKSLSEATKHQYFGWKHIRELTKDTERACDCSSSIIVHPPPQGDKNPELGLKKVAVDAIVGPNAVLLLDVGLLQDGLEVVFHHDPNLLSQNFVDDLSQKFEQMIKSLNSPRLDISVESFV